MILSLVGVFLVCSAGLKAVSDPTTGVVIPGISAAWLHIVSIAFEVALGCWLVAGVSRPAAWIAAVVAFAGFLGTSVYSVWIGSASCGCFGEFSLHPWWAVGIDSAVLLLLVTVGRPAAVRSGIGGAALFAVNFAVVVAAVTGWAVYHGSTERAVAAVRGDAVVVEPMVLDFGTAGSNQAVTRTVTITNCTDQPIRIIGGTSDCSCTTIGTLPVEVPAGGACEVTIRLRFPASAGQTRRTSQLWTDVPGHKALAVGLVGRSSGDED